MRDVGKEAFPPRRRLRNTEKLTLISSFFGTNLFFLLVFVTHMFHIGSIFSLQMLLKPLTSPIA